MKNMIRLLGWKDGLAFYRRAKSGKMGEIKAGKWNTSFRLRPASTDFDTYEHVFVLKQYDIEIDFEPKIIIDGGANIGMSAIYYALRYPKAKIISLEVSSENFELLKHNTRDFPNVKPVCKGVWNETGHLKIIDEGKGANAFTVQRVDNPSENTIPAISLTDIMKEENVDVLDIVKLDIEGAEKMVFDNNFESWLPRTRLLIVELHDRMQPGSSKSVFNAIAKYDFICETKWENLIFFNRQKL
jgi:FkbM family methyltransferase